MDLTSILFYACAAVALAGALSVAVAPPAYRLPGLVALTAGTAAALGALSAGFAGAAFLVSGLAAALVLPGAGRPLQPSPAGFLFQAGGVAAAFLFVILAYAAFRGSFAVHVYPGGSFNSAAIARLLLDRDVLSGTALAGLLLVAVAGAATAWRGARR